MWFLAESRFGVANAVTQYDKRTLHLCDLIFNIVLIASNTDVLHGSLGTSWVNSID